MLLSFCLGFWLTTSWLNPTSDFILDFPPRTIVSPPTMIKKLLIFGGTGAAGKGILRASLESKYVEKVIVVTRKSIPTHPKMEQVIHTDFQNYSQISEHIKGSDAGKIFDF